MSARRLPPGVLPSSLVDAVARVAGVRAVALIGSRARGDAHAGSDWDFAFVVEERGPSASVVADALRDVLSTHLHTDRVDVVDLARAGAVMRFQAARDGLCVFEVGSHDWDDFCVAAAQFWCDAGPIIERAQRAFLAGFPAPGGAAAEVNR